ncbi:MAG: hypothetical protein WD250_04745 [Egibacteraceae bacterium]
MVQRHNRRGWAEIVPLAAAAVLLLAACSPGEGSGGTDGGDDPGVLTAEDCQRYVGAFQQAGAVNDPSHAEAVGQVAGILDDGADRVPDEISDDFRVMAGAYQGFADALQDMNTDFADLGSLSELDPEDLTALDAANRALNTPQVQDAAANIDAFLTEHCT